jgi:hypothetical protein
MSFCMLVSVVLETVCKDTTNIRKLIVLENFSSVKKCQSADCQEVEKQKWKLFDKLPLKKLSILVSLTAASC